MDANRIVTGGMVFFICILSIIFSYIPGLMFGSSVAVILSFTHILEELQSSKNERK